MTCSHAAAFLFLISSLTSEWLTSHLYLSVDTFLCLTAKWGLDGSRADVICCMSHMGSWRRWEKWRGMRWNGGTKILSPSFSSQSDPRPAVQCKRLSTLKINADQSVIFLIPPCLPSTRDPFHCLFTTVPRGSVSLPSLLSSEDNIAVYSLKSCSPVRRRENTLTPTGT